MQLLLKAKHSLTAMAQKEVCPRDEIADPPGEQSNDRGGGGGGIKCPLFRGGGVFKRASHGGIF